jgi:phosphohistidine phosphatase
VIRATDNRIGSLMLVGHNPDMTSLFNSLCGFQTDNMPTCAVATIEFQGGWRDLAPNFGRLLDYKRPGDL